MARYSSADDAMRAYLALYGNLLKGFDPYAMRGRIYENRCQICKTVGKWRKQDGHWYCAAPKCGADRPWKPAGVLKGYFQHGLARVTLRSPRGCWRGRVQMKPSARIRWNTTSDILADLGRIWIVLTQEEFALLRLRVFWEGWAPMMRELQRRASWKRWSEREVRRIVCKARKKAEQRMVSMGLMDREDLAA